MQSFREYIVTNEAMTMATRMKMKAAFRKNKVKIAIGRKKAAKKLASPEKLKQRAQKQARNILINKLLKNRNKKELTYAQRQALEVQMAKKQGAVLKIAKKLLPAVKKADREKVKARRNDQSS
jgi:hypothetical protein|tara:strand:- start:233 stop:601 length:369 start_codon:yes stop_codon:yes gene_type:complete